MRGCRCIPSRRCPAGPAQDGVDGLLRRASAAARGLARPRGGRGAAPPRPPGVAGDPRAARSCLPVDAADAALEAAREAARRVARRSASRSSSRATRIERTREQLGARVDWPHLRALVAELADGESALRRAHARGAPRAPARAAGAVRRRLRRRAGRAPADEGRARRAAGRRPLRLQDEDLSPDQPGPAHRRLGHARAARRGALERGAASVEAIVEPATGAPDGRRARGGVDRRGARLVRDASTRATRSTTARSFNLHARGVQARRLRAPAGRDVRLQPGGRPAQRGDRATRSRPSSRRASSSTASAAARARSPGRCTRRRSSRASTSPSAGPHTRPSFYIKMGLDAAVAYPTVTLQLGNPLPVPRRPARVGAGRASSAPRSSGRRRPRDVTFVRRIDEVVRFPERETADRVVAQGRARAQAAGHPRLQGSRAGASLRDGTVLGARAPDQDYYPPTAQIWKVGKGPDDPKFEAHDDEHPEYVADEFLEMREGVDAKGEPAADPVAAAATRTWSSRACPADGHLRVDRARGLRQGDARHALPRRDAPRGRRARRASDHAKESTDPARPATYRERGRRQANWRPSPVALSRSA